jgi:hypothetical protein
LAELLRPYRGEWVALSSDEKNVLGHGDTIDQALQQAKEKAEERPVLIKSPDQHTAFLL